MQNLEKQAIFKNIFLYERLGKWAVIDLYLPKDGECLSPLWNFYSYFILENVIFLLCNSYYNQ